MPFPTANLGGIPDITAADPMKAVTDAMEESSDWMNTFLGVVSSLFAPEEEDEGIYSSARVF